MSMAEEHYESEEETFDARPALMQELWLGALETVINGVIDLDPPTRAEVAANESLVVRVKTSDPNSVFYVLCTREGLEFSHHSPGPAKVRISGTVMSLLAVLAGRNGLDDSPRIHVWGDADQVGWLVRLARQLNLRTSAQKWLHDHMNLHDIWEKIRGHDPTWIADLLPLPGMMKDIQTQLKTLSERVEQQKINLAEQQELWQAQRRWDLGMVVALMTLMAFALLPGDSLGQRLDALTTERLLWIGLTLSLVAARIWRR